MRSMRANINEQFFDELKICVWENYKYLSARSGEAHNAPASATAAAAVITCVVKQLERRGGERMSERQREKTHTQQFEGR